MNLSHVIRGAWCVKYSPGARSKFAHHAPRTTF